MRLFLPLLCLSVLLILAGCGQPQASETPVSPTRPAADVAAPTTPTPFPTSSAEFDVPLLETGPAAPTAAPTVVQTDVEPGLPVRVQIQSLNLDQPLIKVGLDENLVPIVPKHDVGWYEYSARPGQGENIVLWGHVLRFRDAPDIPAPFANLRDVQPGEQITLYDADGNAHTYEVSELVWATPDQVEYILPRGEEMLTLVSCIGDQIIEDNAVSMSHRLITIARPVS